MTRRLTDGAETYAPVYLYYSRSTVKPRTGSYSYQFNAAVGTHFSMPIGVGVTEFYVRYSVWFSALEFSGATLTLFGWGAATPIGELRIQNSPRKLQIYDDVGSTVIAEVVQDVSVGAWHNIELHVKMGVTGICQLKLDGVLIIDYAGAMDPGGPGYETSNFMFYSTSPITYYDDIAINDTAGGIDDSWIGDIGIVRYLPNLDGDAGQWGLGGYPMPLTDTWASLQGPPLSVPGAPFLYIETSTPGYISTVYNPFATIPALSIIRQVWLSGAFIYRSADDVAFIWRNGSDVEESPQTISTPPYGLYFSSLIGDYHKVDPVGSQPWTIELLRQMQWGVIAKTTSGQRWLNQLILSAEVELNILEPRSAGPPTQQVF